MGTKPSDGAGAPTVSQLAMVSATVLLSAMPVTVFTTPPFTLV